MPEYLLHGLWSNDVGLMLWVEQREGHKIVTAESVDPQHFPAAVWQILNGRRFSHFQPVTLMTPKGRNVNIAKLPTVALTPEQAVQALALLSTVRGVTSTKAQRAAIAPDLWWLVRMYEGLEQFVRAGRVSIRMAFREQQWWPQWVLAPSLAERGWVAQMTACAPGVLVRNAGATVAEDIAEMLPHWIANALLRDIDDSPRPREWHPFTRSLLRSTSLHRANPQLLNALSEWRTSITTGAIGLVVLIEEPPESETAVRNVDDMLWPVRVLARTGVDAPQPVALRRMDSTMATALKDMHQRMTAIAPVLDYRRDLPSGFTAVFSDRELGDWDSVLTTEELAQFVGHTVEKLKKAGITVMLPKAWLAKKESVTGSVRVSGGPLISKFGLDQIVSYDWKVSVGDTELNKQQMLDLVRSKSGLLHIDGQWVVADSTQIRQVKEFISSLRSSSKSTLRKQADEARMRAELAQVRGDANWKELQQQAEELAALVDSPDTTSEEATLADLREIALRQQDANLVEFKGDPWYQQLIGVFEGEEPPAPQRQTLPPSVNASLREYQHRGVDWLAWMSANGVGAVLADDMGLGKTLQLLSLEALERDADGGDARGPTLVVAPTSVVGNWAQEAAKFVPNLRVLVLHGAHRAKGEALISAVSEADLVVTSYGVLQRDVAELRKIHFERVVLDEAQAIKNARTKASRAARALPSRHRIALTGTPIENKLAELHSILDFVNPGVLGTQSFFRNHYARAIERYQDEDAAARLRTLSAPFILRRLKSDPTIIDDLPEKNEEIRTVALTHEQAALYEAFVHGIEGELSAERSIEARGTVLMAITKIKQICNHPAHFLGDHSSITYRGKHRSGKVAELMKILSEARMAGEKVLIFTQYRAFGDLLVPYLEEYFGSEIPFLHGGVSKAGRDRMVEAFQHPGGDGAPAMVLSLKAGGTGLNLTAANVVVHMDRWWNPAVENQATDRAYRIGQGRNVRVYKLLAKGTLEEAINDVINGKIELANAVVGTGEGWLTELHAEELMELMRLKGRES